MNYYVAQFYAEAGDNGNDLWVIVAQFRDASDANTYVTYKTNLPAGGVFVAVQVSP